MKIVIIIFNLEALLDYNPDVILAGNEKQVQAFIARYEQKAVQNGHVYPINGELALGFGPIGRSYGIDAIVEALNP